MPSVTLGKKAPPFNAETTGGKISSKDLLGRPWVLYFYPKDDTPGCTTEGTDFRELYGRFRRRGASIWGVSRDSLASHEKFKAKYSAGCSTSLRRRTCTAERSWA
jgi:peroxiredoxin Q/BCP